MSGHVQVGQCPKCGAPVYAPAVWQGVTPPPVTHSCGCVVQPQVITTTGTSIGTSTNRKIGEVDIC